MESERLIQILESGIKTNKEDELTIQGLTIVEAMRCFGVDPNNWEHKGPEYIKSVRIGFNEKLANQVLENVVEIDANAFYPRILLSLDVDSTLKAFVEKLLKLRDELTNVDKEKANVIKLATNKFIGMLGSKLSIY